MIRKKIGMLLATTLVFAMSTSLFVGCSSNNTSSNSTAKAGTYTATEKGFGGDVTVNVTIAENGSIESIDVTADSETPDIGGKAAPQIAENIVTNQSLAVDTVSGATVTSTAVLTAITNALTESGANIDALKNAETAKKGENEEATVDVVVVGAGGSGTAC